jgi:hypothetical protein
LNQIETCSLFANYNVAASQPAAPEPAPAAAAPASKPPPPAKAKVTARALFNYEAANDEELTLVEHQIVEITKEDDSGWWQGIVNGKEGWFPANYVEKC